MLALAGLIYAAYASGVLVQASLRGVAAPGCSENADCEAALNSIYGKLPLIGTPVSFIGLAYFLSAIVGLILSINNGPPKPLRIYFRLGILASIAYVVVNALEGFHCMWCYRSHAGNLIFWISLETGYMLSKARSPKPTTTSSAAAPSQSRGLLKGKNAPAGWTALSFAALAALLAAAGLFTEKAAQRHHESELDAAVAKMVAAATAAAKEAEAEAERLAAAETEAEAIAEAEAEAEAAWFAQGLTGRYHWGGRTAPIRIVMFTGYQCPDCYTIETQLERIMRDRRDISVSIKHFPFNGQCNPTLERTVNQHPNACWAARAAEAAGAVAGDAAFFSMHRQLFQRRGVFETQDQLAEMARNAGIDNLPEFFNMLNNPRINEFIAQDAQEAKDLGLMFTPMIFINGVELKGWAAPNALVRAVDAIAATNPPARDATNDRPPRAIDRVLADWKDAPRIDPPGLDNQLWRGPENKAINPTTQPDNAKIRIIVWGDYTDPTTAELDAIVRNIISRRTDAAYAFRHFPADQACNPALPRTVREGGCQWHLAAIAAQQTGGHEPFFELHDWLMEQTTRSRPIEENRLRGAAMAAGLDPDNFAQARSAQNTQQQLAADTAAWNQVNTTLRQANPLHRQGVPAIWINGRIAVRWKLDDTALVQRLVELAANE